MLPISGLQHTLQWSGGGADLPCAPTEAVQVQVQVHARVQDAPRSRNARRRAERRDSARAVRAEQGLTRTRVSVPSVSERTKDRPERHRTPATSPNHQTCASFQNPVHRSWQRFAHAGVAAALVVLARGGRAAARAPLEATTQLEAADGASDGCREQGGRRVERPAVAGAPRRRW
eukprot:scaffold44477_cov49-Phaeocystis_antarctica.AAC.1